MSLTAGLSTALSGLQTSQRGLDVVAQNVSNLNTTGYSRKVMNQESVVLNGAGSGVRVGNITRVVNEGLLKDIRRQSGSVAKLQVQQNYFPRIDQLFGEVGSGNSIAHKVSELAQAFTTLSGDASSAATQWSTMQSGQDVADNLNFMTDQLQGLRAQADQDIASSVEDINSALKRIHELNLQIVKHSAISTGTSELEDQRDQALTELSENMDIQYYTRFDGSVTVFAGTGGQLLLDDSPQYLHFTPSSIVNSSMTAAGGQFGKISVDSGTADLTPMIGNGKLKALIDLRDKSIPDMQANLDQLTAQLKDTINQVHNRGTSLPNVASKYEGSRTFAWQAGQPAARQQTMRLSSPDQDVMLLTFDPSGNQTGKISLREVMQTAFTATPSLPGDAPRDAADFTAQGANEAWTINEVSAHIEGWLRSQGNTSARVNLDAQGKMVMDTGSPSVALTFRDQGSLVGAIPPVNGTVSGAPSKDATIIFNTSGMIGSDGNPVADQTVQGFSNFFGLNDFFVNGVPNSNYDSDVLPSGFTTASASWMKVYDQSGQIGTTLKIPQGASLDTIAKIINNQTHTNESDSLTAGATWTTTTPTNFVIRQTNGATTTAVVPPGTYTLDDMVTAIQPQLTAAGITVEKVTEGPYERLRFTQGVRNTATPESPLEGGGKALEVVASGGAVGGSPLDFGQTLNMAPQQHVQAAVVPEGSGYRLRIRQTDGTELFLSARPDAQGKTLLSELGLQPAATNSAAHVKVRDDIKAAPEKISRGEVQWNPDVGRYYLSVGDNSNVLDLATAMNAKRPFETSGGLHSAQYTLSEFSAATVALSAQEGGRSKTQLEYEENLCKSLTFQQASLSGVNLDEEVAKMMDFQQAYSAAARVISVLQEMLETLTNMVR